MKASDVETELEMKIAVALSLTAGSTGPLNGTIKGLNKVDQAHMAELASGRMTEAQYTKKCRDLLNILSNFDGLISEVDKGASQ